MTKSTCIDPVVPRVPNIFKPFSRALVTIRSLNLDCTLNDVRLSGSSRNSTAQNKPLPLMFATYGRFPRC